MNAPFRSLDLRSRLATAILAALGLAALGLAMPGLAAAGDCGCEQTQRTCGCQPTHVTVVCNRHCRHGHCHGRDHAPLPPTGPVYESTAMRAAPVAMYSSELALVGGVRYAVASELPVVRVAETRAATLRSESTCEGSSARLDALEARVNSMRQELNLIRDSMVIQEELLREIKGRLPPKPMGEGVR